MSNQIPMMQEPRDVMRLGLGNVKSDVEYTHPMEIVGLKHDMKTRQTRKQLLSTVYGSHFPMRLQMEEHILAQFQRFPGLKTSFAGLETMLGEDTEIEFKDYLDDPEFREERPDVLAQMELRLGDKPLGKFT